MKYSVCILLLAFIGTIAADEDVSDAYADYYKQYYEAHQAGYGDDIPAHLQQTVAEKQAFIGDTFITPETTVSIALY